MDFDGLIGTSLVSILWKSFIGIFLRKVSTFLVILIQSGFPSGQGSLETLEKGLFLEVREGGCTLRFQTKNGKF